MVALFVLNSVILPVPLKVL